MELRWPGWLTRRSRAGRLSRMGASAFQNSTLAELAWQRARNASTRWALWGAVIGTLVGVVVFAPASWLASAVARATDQRLLLADAKGSVWSGDAQLLLTGGAGSRDAAALPGRLRWQIRPRLNGFELALNQACCLDREWVIQFKVGFGRYQVLLPARPQALGHWPAAWLAGLGTPFNTLQLGGTLLLTSNGMTLESVQGQLAHDRQHQCRPLGRVVAPVDARHAGQLPLQRARRRHQHRPGHVEPGNTRRRVAPVRQRTMDGLPGTVSR